jgi:hypothetical protein
MTTELEKYLKTATRGLWGKKKLEVREELENHLLEQSRKFELQGFKQTDAIQKVLEQIGPANIVSRGMIGVHTMPAIRSGLLIGALVAAAFSLTATGVAQVAISVTYGTKDTITTMFLNVDSLINNLQGVGFEATKNGQQLEMKFGETTVNVPFTAFNSQEKEGQLEIDVHNVFNAFQKAKVPLRNVNDLQRLAFDIGGKEIVLDATPEEIAAWNRGYSLNWTFSHILSQLVPNPSQSLNLQMQDNIQPIDATLEVVRPELAGKVITVSAFQKLSTDKDFSAYITNTLADKQGRFQVKLPAGSYMLANQQDTGFKLGAFTLEMAKTNKAVLLVGVRQADWVASMNKTHQLFNFKTKTITLKSGQKTQVN